jgi:Plasmid pRiA4b ORF-3-like protein
MYFGPTVHVLRVSLRDVEPEVWRRVVVASEMPSPNFATALELAMGWGSTHLHLFAVGGVLFGNTDHDAPHLISEKAAKVTHLLPREQSSLRWDYDFGDGWEHDVVVEAIEPLNPKTQYPVVLDGERACPPDDVGGPPGYEQLLRVLNDPTDEEYEHMVSWAPEGFDPAAFDLVAANRRLRAK